MSDDAWYLRKAEECLRLAKETADPERRARYENEAQRWREIAADIAKNEKDRFGSDAM